MTDIVERLRSAPPSLSFDEHDPTFDLRHEAAAEIERLRAGGCARDQTTTQFCAEVYAAVAAEREACAKIADESTASISIIATSAEWDAGWIRHGKEIAAAIRSRGQS